jgi:transcriptional regulator with XRE-family HTH domain
MARLTTLFRMGRAAELARRRLAQWRQDRRETQKAIGDLVGWDQATVSKFELGIQPATVDQLDALAGHYGKSLSELFADLDPAEPDQPLKEWMDFYWRLNQRARDAQLEAWRETVPKATRPSGLARRSVKRERESAAGGPSGDAVRVSGKPRQPSTRRK